MLNLPEYLIIDCKAELQAIQWIACELDMPVLDLDSTMAEITAALGSQHDEHELRLTAFHLAQNGDLFENSELDHGQSDRVYEAVMSLGRKFKQKLADLKVYEHGHFNYLFKNFINEDTLLFTREHK